MKQFLAAVTVLTTLVASAGNVCTWKGGSGKFSDDNWDIKPVDNNGDTIVIDSTLNNNEPIVIENDLADGFRLAELKFVKQTDCVAPGAVTINGKQLYFNTAAKMADVVVDQQMAVQTDRGPVTTYNVPIRLKNGTFYIGNQTTWNGRIDIDDSGSVFFKMQKRMKNQAGSADYLPEQRFNGEIYGPNASWNEKFGENGAGCNVYYAQKVTLKNFYTAYNKDNCAQYARFLHADNEIGLISIVYGSVYLQTANALSASTKIEHQQDEWGNGTLQIQGDQTIEALTISGIRYGKLKVCSWNANDTSKLTLKPKQDYTFDGYFYNGMSLTIDPVESNVTYTFNGTTASTMTGVLEVKGGTLKLVGSASFTAASAVKIRPGATLDLSMSTNAAPIANSAVWIRDGGKIVAPTGGSLTLKAVLLNGVPLPADTYTDTDWAEGTVVVAAGSTAGETYWNANADGLWSVAASWNNGVPAAGMTAYVIAQGDDYTVTGDADEYAFDRLYLNSEGANVSKFAIARDAFFHEGSAFTIETNGVFEQTAGHVVISNCAKSIVVRDGGVWRVSGGTNEVVMGTPSESGNTATYLRIEKGGELQISGGRHVPYQQANYTTAFRLFGGKCVVSNNGIFDNNTRSRQSTHTHGYGELVVKDNDQFITARAGGGDPQGIRYTIRNNAKFTCEIFAAGYHDREVAVFDFGSSNKANVVGGNNCTQLGVNYPCHIETIVRPGAFVTLSSANNWGTRIGGYYSQQGFSYKANVCMNPTGVCTIAGTAIVNSGFTRSKFDSNDTIQGLVIGSEEGSVITAGMTHSRTHSWPRGTLNIEPTGVITNNNGFLAVGLGWGEGDFNIRGGKFVKTSNSGIAMIGAGNGVGSLTITEGGSVAMPVDCHVGGWDTTDGWSWWTNYPQDSFASTGTVSVIDGTLALEYNNEWQRSLTFGKRGSAFFNVGTNGLVKAKDMTLKNSVETVVRFTAGEAGFGTVALSGKLSVDPGVKLVIDCGGVKPSARTLFTFGSLEGTFDDVSFVNVPPAASPRLVVSEDKVRVTGFSGAVLLIR